LLGYSKFPPGPVLLIYPQSPQAPAAGGCHDTKIIKALQHTADMGALSSTTKVFLFLLP
jgi:hypothetical protein